MRSFMIYTYTIYLHLHHIFTLTPYILRVTNTRTVRLAGHVVRMGGERNFHGATYKTQLGRSSSWWEDDIETMLVC